VAQLLDQIFPPAIGSVTAVGHGCGPITLLIVGTMRYATAYFSSDHHGADRDGDYEDGCAG
jgi:hypothetical protein